MDNELQQITPNNSINAGSPAAPQAPPPPDPAPLGMPQRSKSRPRGIIIIALIAGIILGLIVGWLIGHSSGGQQKQSVGNSNSGPTSNPSSGSGSASSVSNGSQAYARDTKRRMDIQSLQTQLEAFFSQQGYYPSLTDMNNASWQAANMKNLDAAGTMADPSSNCNPATTACLVASPKAQYYAYAVSNPQGASCESNDTTCAQYTLTATLESTYQGGKTYTKTNLD